MYMCKMKFLEEFLLLAFIVINLKHIFAIPMPDEKGLNSVNITSNKSESLSSAIRQCLMKSEITRCFKKRIIQTLENVINDNGTWYLSDYIVVEKDSNWTVHVNVTNYNNLNEVLMSKVKDLAESRAIRLRVPPDVLQEGRKRKDKGDKGGYAVMGGLAMAGLLAQLFMGKIAMLAGVALITAKIALLFSVLNSLKKAAGGSPSEHVIYADSASGGHGGGWHRNFPRHANEEAYGGPYQHEEERLYQP